MTSMRDRLAGEGEIHMRRVDPALTTITCPCEQRFELADFWGHARSCAKARETMTVAEAVPGRPSREDYAKGLFG
jgi:hypothetical protein